MDDDFPVEDGQTEVSLASFESLNKDFIMTNHPRRQLASGEDKKEKDVPFGAAGSYKAIENITKRLKDIPIKLSAYNCPGMLKKNEDRILLSCFPLCFAVFDGHAGPKVSTFCRKNFPSFYKASILSHGVTLSESSSHSFPTVHSHSQMRDIITLAFSDTNAAVNADTGCASGGSTATIAFFYNSVTQPGDYIVVANVGDSEAFSISCESKTMQSLTEVHNVMNKEEAKRVTDIDPDAILGDRLYAVISVTRSFGDFDYAPALTCQPFISEPLKVGEERQKVVIASDGVWDFVKPREKVGELALHSENDEAAYEISNQAMKNEGLDDISCIVLDVF